MQDGFDVIVVGAGVAGLAGGRALAESGKRVLIVEARDRIGGRILTKEVGNIQVELGAEFIHGLPPELIRVIEEAGLQTRELGGAQYCWQDGNLSECDSELTDTFDWLESLKAVKKDDCSFEEFLAEAPVPEEYRSRLRSYVEGFNAADSKIIGAASLGKQQAAEDEIDGDRLFHLQGGYAQLPQFLETKLKEAGGQVLLDSCVTEVRWERGKVEILCARLGKQLSFRGKCAVISLPLGVLQERAVRFIPDPTEVSKAVKRMRMGQVWRAVMLFRDRFWAKLTDGVSRGRLNELSFLFSSNTVPSTWWTPYPDQAATLTAWVGGPRAQNLARLGPEESKQHLVETLSRIFDVKEGLIHDELLEVVFHDWERDPFSRGAYSYVPAGALEISKRMAEPVEQTLFFAGEHTDITGHWGTVHGALRSGLRAASQVAALEEM